MRKPPSDPNRGLLRHESLVLNAGGSVCAYAVMYNRERQLSTNIFERFLPGCFSEWQKRDVICLYNSDPNYLLGRRNSGTLHLDTDRDGLFYSVKDNPGDFDHLKVRKKIESGNVTGSSLVYKVLKDRVRSEGKRTVFEVQKAEIISVGPSVWPDSLSLRVNQRYIKHRVKRAVTERLTDVEYMDSVCATLGI
jgi:HK97 family phage prohead protease|tara:strand:- start:69 stop:647 length:579 start_codon:yes stop_codon:yes gene_type:complete